MPQVIDCDKARGPLTARAPDRPQNEFWRTEKEYASVVIEVKRQLGPHLEKQLNGARMEGSPHYRACGTVPLNRRAV